MPTMFESAHHFALHGATFNDIKGNYNHTQNTYVDADDALEKYRKWLAAPDPSINHNIARDRWHENSGKWLLEDERYVTWKKSKNSFMFINGISGCGKTIICSTIIEDLTSINHSPESGLAYFYFDINDQTKQTTKSLLCSLVLALVAASGAHNALLDLYHKYHQVYSPTTADLLDMLLKLMKSFGRAYVVIDALDECTEYDQLDKVFKKIIGHCHLLVTGRREQYILAALQPCAPVEIILSADLVKNDIITYVYDIFKAEPKLKRWCSVGGENIQEILVQGANGMFRWAACQMDQLRKCHSQKAVLTALQNLPKTLEDIYDQILQRISESDVPNAIVLLHWLVMGMQPLTFDELRVAASFDPTTKTFDPSLTLADPADVIEICSSLVTEGAKNTVTLAHASVKEYFLKAPKMLGDQQLTICHTPQSHALITESCITYLLELDHSLYHTILAEYHLAGYAAKYWFKHYKMCKRNPDLDKLVLLLFQPYGKPFLSWVRLHDIDADGQIWHKRPQQYIATSLYYASLLQLDEDIIANVATMTHEINATNGGKYGSALQAAAYAGNLKLLQILLDKGADINVEGGYYGTALKAATCNNHIEAVKFLIENGADVNTEGRTNIEAADEYGSHGSILFKLLDNVVTDDEGVYGSALQVAIECGHVEIAKFLLDNGADVNAEGERCGTVLYTASSHGDVEMVRILLKKGADPNTWGGEHECALKAAVVHEHGEIVELLVANGADINANFETPLYSASKAGSVAMVKLLLDLGAEVNANGLPKKIPLEGAVYGGNVHVIRLLLGRGADVNCEIPYGEGCPLGLACHIGKFEVVSALVNGGANVNAVCGTYGNALELAASHDNSDILKLLLDNGADVNAQYSGYYGNVLQAVSCLGYVNCAELLLDRGADVNAQCGYYGNALHGASHCGQVEVVKLLLTWGADVNVYAGYPAGKHGTALSAAVENNHVAIVNLLLDSGVDTSSIS